MSELNVRLKDMAGNILYPTTNASIVKNNAGQYLGDVEAGAQVNVIESITINGETGTMSGKAISFQIDALAEYSLEKLAQPDTGYAATYQLTKDGTGVGDKINIPKDLVVESGTVKTCEQDNVPVEGYRVGDVYIDIVLANADDQHIYIKATDLVDVYTAGNGLTLNDHEFNVNTADTSVFDTAPTSGSTKAVQSGGTYTAIENAKQAVKDEIYERIWSNMQDPDSGYFFTENTNSNGTVARIFNEPDGGGSQLIDGRTNIQAYTGTNEGSDGSNIYVQTYAVDKDTKVGTRLNINQNGAYLTIGQNSPTFSEDDKIATAADVAGAGAGVLQDAKDYTDDLRQTILNKFWSNKSSFDTGYFNTKYTAANGSYALMFNENDGGGSQVYDKTDDVISYVGTNLEEGTSADTGAVNVQIYSKNKTSNVGARLNVSTEGIYYTSGKTNGSYVAADEVATVGAVANNYYDKTTADTLFLTYEILS